MGNLDIFIPINHHNIYCIGEHAFEYNQYLKKVTHSRGR